MTEPALNPAFVRAVTPGAKVRRYRDGNGLYLLVRPAARSAGKLWVQRLTVHGKERELGLGSADRVSLKEARRIALENRRIARSGDDPRGAGARSAPTFADAVGSVLAPIWTAKPGGAVMKWAVAQGYRTDNPAGDALTAALPKVAGRATPMRALPHAATAAPLSTRPPAASEMTVT